jgi:hypothetical protein
LKPQEYSVNLEHLIWAQLPMLQVVQLTGDNGTSR